MTEHEHMPPIHRYTARWLTEGRLLIKFPSVEYVLTWGEAHALATAITEALQMEARP